MKKKTKAKRTPLPAGYRVSFRSLPFPFDEPAPAPKPAAPAPSFGLGVVIQSASLVTDRSGVAWWIDPQRRLIRKV